MRIFLEGDQLTASSLVGYAKSRLRALKVRMADLGQQIASKRIALTSGVEIDIKSVLGQDEIRIMAQGGELLIICYVGDTTGDFSSKRFYNDSGKEIARNEVGYTGELPIKPSGWMLIDDGLYGPMITPAPDPVDPWNNAYAYNPGGIGIPACGSGVSSKKQSGKSVRYVLNGALEDETFEAIAWTVPIPGYSYNFVRQIDSLTFAPYSMYAPRPYFIKYFGNHVLAMIVPWYGYEATFTMDVYADDNFLDVVPIMRNIWKIMIADGARSNRAVEGFGSDSSYNQVAIGAAAYKDGEDSKVRLVRPKANDWSGSSMLEPIREETYNMTTGVVTPGLEYHRCADPANENCYFYDAWIDSGYPDVASTIGDDVRVPHSINSTGQQTYVRIRKSGLFDSVNTGLYCGDALVEESGWEAVIKPYDPERRGPILIRNTRYRIIHVYAEDGFKAVVYSRTKYVSHSDELLGYTAFIDGSDRQVRKTMIRSHTTYHVSVNGVITDLGFSNYRREYRLTLTWDAYTGAPLTSVTGGHIVERPWVDCGYDAAGNLLGEDNSCVMRCDTNSAKGKLFVGFDVFPVAYRHDLVFDAHGNLSLEFDTTVMAVFPPSSDAVYPAVKDRKWMIFGSSGVKLKDITPPQLPDSGGHVHRINGLAFMGA